MKQIILASTSPRRKEILEMTGLSFITEASSYEEDMTLSLNNEELAKTLSLGKAEAVAKNHTNTIVIGSDTFVTFEGKRLGKPHTPEKAKEMLQMLSSKKHTVFTGLAIIDTDTKKTISEAILAAVFFREMSEAEIDGYIRTGEPLDKAGAYAVQGKGAMFIEKIDGDFFSIMGLPLSRLVERLEEFDVTIFL